MAAAARRQPVASKSTAKKATRKPRASVELPPGPIELVELNYEQGAAVLNVSVRTLQRLVQQEGAVHTRIGRSVRFTYAQLQEIAQSKVHRATPLALPRPGGRRSAPRLKVIREKTHE